MASQQMDLDMAAADFKGETYDRDLDRPRLLTQLQRVKDYMADGPYHSLRAISEATGAPEASVSARLRDMRRPVDKKGLGLRIDDQRMLGGLWLYRWVQAE